MLVRGKTGEEGTSIRVDPVREDAINREGAPTHSTKEDENGRARAAVVRDLSDEEAAEQRAFEALWARCPMARPEDRGAAFAIWREICPSGNGAAALMDRYVKAQRTSDAGSEPLSRWLKAEVQRSRTAIR